jgi:superoxide dismutase, Fe-Mn family
MKPIRRRDALNGIALGGASLITGCAATTSRRPTTADSQLAAAALTQPPTSGETQMTAPYALASNHQVEPLPFKAAALNGISERMITSHHENNYAGAVKNLNRAEQELLQITTDTPTFVVSALRERELTFRNSKTLHEAYFANLGGNGHRSGAIEAAIASAYGTAARWEQHMRATAMGLGGGSGWAILAYELDTGALRTISAGNHTQTLATGFPLLVMDMYEHSYQIDFGAGAARYIDAFFANIKWDEVNRRLDRAQRVSAILRGSAG